MQISLDVGAGELISATKQLTISTAKALRMYSADHHKQWMQRKIIKHIIKTRPGELPIANPSIHGLRPGVIANLCNNEDEAMSLLAASMNSIRGQELRCKRSSRSCGLYEKFKKALESFVAGSFHSKVLAIRATGYLRGERSEMVVSEQEKQTEIIATYGMQAKAAYHVGGKEALQQLLPHVHRASVDSTELLPYDEISPDSEVRGALITSDDVFIFVRNAAGDTGIITTHGLYVAGNVGSFEHSGEQKHSPPLASLSGDPENIAEEYRKASLTAIRENRTVLAWVFFHAVAGRVIVDSSDTGDFYRRQNDVTNSVLEDLRMCRAAQSQVRALMRHGGEESILLNFKAMKQMSGTELDQAVMKRMSITLSDLPEVWDYEDTKNCILEPNFAASDRIARTGVKRLISHRDPKIKKKTLNSDLNHIRFRALNSSERDLQSTSGIDAELSKSKVNIAEREKDLLVYLPFNSHAVFLFWNRELSGPKKDLYQHYSSIRMMPYMLPATLLAGLDLFEDESVCALLTDAFRGDGTIINLLEYTESRILDKPRSNSEIGKTNVVSKLMSSAMTRALTTEERTWIHREMLDYLVDVGAFNSGQVIGKSCYFDTSVTMYQTAKAPIAVTVDISTPLDGLSALVLGKEAQLINNKQKKRTAKITQDGVLPRNVGNERTWSGDEAVHMTPSIAVDPKDSEDFLVLNEFQIVKGEAAGTSYSGDRRYGLGKRQAQHTYSRSTDRTTPFSTYTVKDDNHDINELHYTWELGILIVTSSLNFGTYQGR